MAELSLSLPVKGEEAPGADGKVNAAFTEIQTQFNGKVAAVNLEAGAVTGAKTSADLTGLRLLGRVGGFVGQTEVAGTYFLRVGSNAAKKATASAVKYTLDVPEIANYNPTDFAIAGKATKMTLAVSLVTNNVAPSANFTFGLYPVEQYGGAENEVEIKYTTVVAGSTIKIEPTEAKQNFNGKVVFGFPAAKFYSIGVETSAETAAKSLTVFNVQLFAKNE